MPQPSLEQPGGRPGELGGGAALSGYGGTDGEGPGGCSLRKGRG